MANSVDPDETAPIIGAVCSGSSMFASILNLSVMLGNYLQQTTFSDAFFSWRLGLILHIQNQKEHHKIFLSEPTVLSMKIPSHGYSFHSLTRGRGIAGSSLTGGIALCP